MGVWERTQQVCARAGGAGAPQLVWERTQRVWERAHGVWERAQGVWGRPQGVGERAQQVSGRAQQVGERTQRVWGRAQGCGSAPRVPTAGRQRPHKRAVARVRRGGALRAQRAALRALIKLFLR